MATHLIRGDWRPGERIPAERELCQKLGVGRASLREALKALEIMGMIETRLGDGTYVCQKSEFFVRPLLWAITSSSATQAQELVEARRLIEVELSGFAAERATAEDLAQIRRHLERMEKAIADREEFLQADIDFHLAIGHAGHNVILMNALLLIRNLLQQWISSSLTIQGAARKALDQHKRVYARIAKQNVAGARSAMQEHLEAMTELLLKSQSQQDPNFRAPNRTRKA
jgi:GntR family transcriptional repressor for pyruvate dehydrogenase complex